MWELQFQYLNFSRPRWVAFHFRVDAHKTFSFLASYVLLCPSASDCIHWKLKILQNWVCIALSSRSTVSAYIEGMRQQQLSCSGEEKKSNGQWNTERKKWEIPKCHGTQKPLISSISVHVLSNIGWEVHVLSTRTRMSGAKRTIENQHEKKNWRELFAMREGILRRDANMQTARVVNLVACIWRSKKKQHTQAAASANSNWKVKRKCKFVSNLFSRGCADFFYSHSRCMAWSSSILLLVLSFIRDGLCCCVHTCRSDSIQLIDKI